MDNVFKNKFPLLDSSIYFKGNNWGESYSDSQREKLYKNYLKFIASKNDVVSNVATYFGGKLHDSWVTEVYYKNNQIGIALNEFASHCFSDAICEEFNIKIPHKKRILPIILNFSRVKKFSVSRINNNSKILPLKKEKFLPKLKEFLFDEIIILDKNKIEIGIIFWSGLNGNKSELLLQIECENLEIIQSQRKAFEILFKGKYLNLYDVYWEQKLKGKNFDFSVAQKLIREKT